MAWLPGRRSRGSSLLRTKPPFTSRGPSLSAPDRERGLHVRLMRKAGCERALRAPCLRLGGSELQRLQPALPSLGCLPKDSRQNPEGMQPTVNIGKASQCVCLCMCRLYAWACVYLCVCLCVSCMSVSVHLCLCACVPEHACLHVCVCVLHQCVCACVSLCASVGVYLGDEGEE